MFWPVSADFANLTALPAADSLRILQLRLIIARAAQSDSMRWWADNSLTPDATLLLDRLFPRSIEQSRKRLALHAARARHHAELDSMPGAVHLFDLGDVVEFEIAKRFQHDSFPDFPASSITSIEELTATLADLLGHSSPRPVNREQTGRVREIEIDRQLTPFQAAELLAWSYLANDAGGPVLPFFRGRR